MKFTRINVEIGEKKLDKKAWLLIRQSYVDEFGLNSDFESLLNLMIELASLQCDFAISKERFLLNEIRRIKTELERRLTIEAEHDIDSAIIHLSKWMHQLINDKEITVKMFHKMLKEYGKDNKKK